MVKSNQINFRIEPDLKEALMSRYHGKVQSLFENFAISLINTSIDDNLKEAQLAKQLEEEKEYFAQASIRIIKLENQLHAIREKNMKEKEALDLKLKQEQAEADAMKQIYADSVFKDYEVDQYFRTKDNPKLKKQTFKEWIQSKPKTYEFKMR